MSMQSDLNLFLKTIKNIGESYEEDAAYKDGIIDGFQVGFESGYRKALEDRDNFTTLNSEANQQAN